MKKIIILILLIIPIYTNAYTKEDILNITNQIKICDENTQTIYNSYKISIERMLNTKNITNENINKIINNMNYAINIKNEYNICKIDDIKSLEETEKNNLINILLETYDIILKSPNIENNNESKKNNTIKVDSSKNKIQIISDDNIISSINTNNKLNDVGVNKIISSVLILNIILFIISIIIKNKHTKISKIIFSSSTIIILAIIILNKPLNKILDIYDLIAIKETKIDDKIIVKDNKIIKYPSINSNIGTLIINNKSDNIIFGDDKINLKKGLGMRDSSYFPGENNTTIISGHNYFNTMNELKNLKINNKIKIKTSYGEFEYKLIKTKIVNNNENIYNYSDKNSLIIYTCYPFNNTIYSKKRFVAYFKNTNIKFYGDTNDTIK